MKHPKVSRSDDGYIIITFGDEAYQYIRRTLNVAKRSKQFKDHGKLIERIRLGYADVVVVVDDTLQLAVAFSLNDEDMRIPSLVMLAEELGIR
jgi:hypothetical protein